MNDARYRKFSLGFIALLVCSGLLLFDFDGRQRIERYNPPGIAHYDLPYDALLPTPRLFRAAFVKGAAAFPRRDTIVLIGNSVITGAGAKDKLFLNKLLAGKFNVLNAGLGGEFLAASLALATIGINTVAQGHPDSFFHIFIAFPPTRLYVLNSNSPTGYWVTGPALYSLAKEENLENHIFKGPGLEPLEESKGVLSDLNNYLVMNMRCMIARQVIQNSFKYRTPYCPEALMTKEVSPAFLENYYHRLPDSIDIRNFIYSYVSLFIDPAFRQGAIQSIAEETSILTRYLDERRLGYKIYFLMLGEAPVSLQSLSTSKQESYRKAKTDFVDDLRTREPGWTVEFFDSLTSGEFFDESHMNEAGQARLAAKILELTEK